MHDSHIHSQIEKTFTNESTVKNTALADSARLFLTDLMFHIFWPLNHWFLICFKPVCWTTKSSMNWAEPSSSRRKIEQRWKRFWRTHKLYWRGSTVKPDSSRGSYCLGGNFLLWNLIFKGTFQFLLRDHFYEGQGYLFLFSAFPTVHETYRHAQEKVGPDNQKPRKKPRNKQTQSILLHNEMWRSSEAIWWWIGNWRFRVHQNKLSSHRLFFYKDVCVALSEVDADENTQVHESLSNGNDETMTCTSEEKLKKKTNKTGEPLKLNYYEYIHTTNYVTNVTWWFQYDKTRTTSNVKETNRTRSLRRQLKKKLFSRISQAHIQS